LGAISLGFQAARKNTFRRCHAMLEQLHPRFHIVLASFARSVFPQTLPLNNETLYHGLQE